MLAFAIPLRSKAKTNDWSAYSQRLNETLRSICANDDKDFRIFIAYNDMPDIDKSYLDKIEFVHTDISVPNGWLEVARDKYWKLLMISIKIRELLEKSKNPEDGIFVMPVDDDDLISRNLVKYVNDRKQSNGFVINKGYVYYANSNKLEKHNQFNLFCGSSNIMKLYLDDMPSEPPCSSDLCHDQKTAGILNERWPIRWDHNLIYDKFNSIGRPLEYIPFRAAIYRRNTGENQSQVNKDWGKINTAPVNQAAPEEAAPEKNSGSGEESSKVKNRINKMSFKTFCCKLFKACYQMCRAIILACYEKLRFCFRKIKNKFKYIKFTDSIKKEFSIQ